MQRGRGPMTYDTMTEYSTSSDSDASMYLGEEESVTATGGSLSDGASVSRQRFSSAESKYRADSARSSRSRSVGPRRPGAKGSRHNFVGSASVSSSSSSSSHHARRSGLGSGDGGEEKIFLQKFDFQRLNNRNGLYLLLGKRNTGKTTWCRFINQHIDASRTGIVVLITQNERLKENWSQHIPKLFIFQPEDANIMSTISRCMNNAIKSCENRGISSHDNRLKLTFILDDVGSESSVMNNIGLKKLASNGRHVNVTVFILAQFLYQVPPKVRSQFEYIFMLASISQKNNKTVNHEFAAHIEHNKFCRILQRSTENHGVLVINTTSSNADDSLYFAHIDQYPIKTVRLGCWIQWAMNHLLYDEHETFDDFCVSEEGTGDGEEKPLTREGIQGDIMVIDVS